jgi:hypothetical protein
MIDSQARKHRLSGERFSAARREVALVVNPPDAGITKGDRP